MKCHSCGTELPEGFRFCHECGEKQGPARQAIFSEDEIAEIEARSQTDEYARKFAQFVRHGMAIERRDVAVLFVDISGYARMCSRLSEDRLREVMRDVYLVMSEAITKREGYVDKFVGDEVMALFGAPIALERPCQRAVTAAEEIVIGLSGVNHRFKDILPAPLSVHAGIAFGKVQAGRLGDSMKLEYTVLGEAVNVAKRLTDAALSGAVFVTRKVEDRAKEAFEFQSLGTLRLADIEEPVEALCLVGPRTITGEWPGFSKLGAPMFGRDKEFGELKEVFDKLASCYPEPEACETGKGRYRQFSRIISIIGEAGVGKSRLKRELRNHLRQHLKEEGFRWLAGGGWTIGQTPLYWPIKMQIASELGFDPGASSQTISEALSRLTPDASDEKELLPYLHHLFGLEYPDSPLLALEPKSIKDNLWIAIRQLYARWSQQKPLVLVFEDVHWSDGGTADFIDYLADFVSDFPILMLMLYRPGFEPKFARRKGVPFTEMKLEPLSSDAETDLLDFYIAPGRRERAFVRRLRHYSEGNPLFVEEFLLMLLEQGKLYADGTKMRLAQDIEKIALPTGLADVLGARFDRLSQRDKRVAYYAAVIGRAFLHSLLSYVHNSLHGEGDVREALDSLVERDIVFQKAIEPELEYVFKHALTREILVSRLTRSLRAELSKLISTRVEDLYSDRIGEFHGMLSEHWEFAGEIRKAARHTALWGLYNQKQQRNFEAQDAFERYDRLCERLSCSPLSPQEEGDLLVSRIDGLQVLGKQEDAIGLCGVLSGLGDPKWRSISLCKEARLRHMAGDWDRALSLAKEALDIAQLIGDRSCRATAVRTIGIVHSGFGEFDKALECYEESLSIRRELGEQRGVAHSIVSIGIVKSIAGEGPEALGFFDEALSIYRKLGDRRNIALSLHEIAIVHTRYGDYDQALLNYNEELLISRELGAREPIAGSLHDIGLVHCHRSEYDRALQCLDESLSVFRELGDRRGCAFALHSMGVVHQERRDFQQALRYLDEALSIFRALGARRGIGSSLSKLAGLHADMGQWHKAKELALQAEAINRSISSRSNLSDSLAVLCRADAAAGAWQASLSFGAEALSMADGLQDRKRMISARLALAEAHLQMAPWRDGEKQGEKPPLARDDAIAKAMDYAAQAKELAEAKGMKGYVNKADELLAQIVNCRQ